MSLKTAFAHVSAMAGVKPPQAGARVLREQIQRLPEGPARSQAEAEIAKWFTHYRGPATPRSIAGYMAAVEAVLRTDVTTGSQA